jgi:hypothetical protein
MSAIRTIRRVAPWVSLAAGLLASGIASASMLPISSLSVNSASLTVAITDDETYSTGPVSVSPPIDVTMGAYQDPILALHDLTSTSGKSITNAKLYSTGAFSKPAPSGSADPTTGSLSVDLSSVRIAGTYGTFNLDVPLFASTVNGTYNVGTGAYTLNINQPFSITLTPSLTFSGTTSGTLSGTVTVVPLPASLALMIPGLLALVGVARRRAAG